MLQPSIWILLFLSYQLVRKESSSRIRASSPCRKINRTNRRWTKWSDHRGHRPWISRRTRRRRCRWLDVVGRPGEKRLCRSHFTPRQICTSTIKVRIFGHVSNLGHSYQFGLWIFKLSWNTCVYIHCMRMYSLSELNLYSYLKAETIRMSGVRYVSKH